MAHEKTGMVPKPTKKLDPMDPRKLAGDLQKEAAAKKDAPKSSK